MTKAFLNNVWNYHTRNKMPATFFLLGRSIEANFKDLERFNEDPLFDFAQHTYSHVAFKDIVEDRGDGSSNTLPGASIDVVEDELLKTNGLIKSCFRRDCLGAEGARGYYKGVEDRPDIVRLLARMNFKYCVTYCRNQNGWNPVGLDVQPFWYAADPEIRLLEIPNQGWQDAAYIKVRGPASVKEYYGFCRESAAYAAKNNLEYSLIMHDWTSYEWDRGFSHTAEFYDYLAKSGGRVFNFAQFHKKMEEEALDAKKFV